MKAGVAPAEPTRATNDMPKLRIALILTALACAVVGVGAPGGPSEEATTSSTGAGPFIAAGFEPATLKTGERLAASAVAAAPTTSVPPPAGLAVQPPVSRAADRGAPLLYLRHCALAGRREWPAELRLWRSRSGRESRRLDGHGHQLPVRPDSSTRTDKKGSSLGPILFPQFHESVAALCPTTRPNRFLGRTADWDRDG